jgi:KUP system potassium uptake protein
LNHRGKEPVHISKLTLNGLIITMGIVYGDIGTSTLYVMKAIVAANMGGIDLNFILGAISCVIWTLTFQTTLKYIIITLRADNNGEGGIFSLYALIRRRKKKAFIFAIIGGATLLADGIITPSITVVSAVEGLQLYNPAINVVLIALAIITALFLVQQFGTKFLGTSFGPIMFLWFTMLGVLGFIQIIQLPVVLKAFNPWYAYNLLVHYPEGFLLLGAIFLCTTGAEALYSDLGHCGLKNIRISWIYVKICLVITYLGQGAWILSNHDAVLSGLNPFFGIMPEWFLGFGIVMATVAAVIASQALISGSYTIISEGILLNFWPKLNIKHPTTIKGQMYVPTINWLLWLFCCVVVLLFQHSSNMEAAYGLSITITMLMTSILLIYYFIIKKIPTSILVMFIIVYGLIEGSFLLSNLDKFSHGGWFTIMMASIIFFIMFVWYKGRAIKNRFIVFVKIEKYIEILKDLSIDESIPKYASNLVYLTRADRSMEIESKVMFSIINKPPKRADRYWFIHVNIVDDPHRQTYTVEQIIPDILIRVNFDIGFKVNPRINLMFRHVVDEMVRNEEINITSRYDSLKKHEIQGDFRFVLIDRIQNYDFDFKSFEQFIMDAYTVIKKTGIPDVRAYGLDASSTITEQVPLMLESHKIALHRSHNRKME